MRSDSRLRNAEFVASSVAQCVAEFVLSLRAAQRAAEFLSTVSQRGAEFVLPLRAAEVTSLVSRRGVEFVASSGAQRDDSLPRLRDVSAWRTFVVASLALLSACAPDVVIGLERQLSITTTAALPDGRFREAGVTTSADGTRSGWFGTSLADRTLPDVTRPGVRDIAGSATLPDAWVLIGTTTLSDGRTAAWVRALASDDSERWTTTLEGPAGASLEGTAIAATFEGDVFVGGVEAIGGVRDGFVALLDSAGAVKWRYRFATDFQQQARGVLPHVVAAVAPPPSSRRHLWVGGTRGDVSYALQMTLDGDLWDSEPYGDGVVVGFTQFDLGLAVCIRSNTGARFAWTQGAGVSGVTITNDSATATFSMASCARLGDRVVAIGSMQHSEVEQPAAVFIERSSRSVVEVREHATQRDATILGGTLVDQLPVPFGNTRAPLRRWRDALR